MHTKIRRFIRQKKIIVVFGYRSICLLTASIWNGAALLQVAGSGTKALWGPQHISAALHPLAFAAWLARREIGRRNGASFGLRLLQALGYHGVGLGREGIQFREGVIGALKT